jgi:arabinose-5-phosphate isomerase
MDHTAGQVATRTPMTTTPDTLLIEALGVMNMNKRSVLLVVDQGRLVGLLHIHDALRAGVA